jgi:multidrug efflux pump subunit AcrA (membrane-fusion protein)
MQKEVFAATACGFCILTFAFCISAHAQGIRDRIRGNRDRSTAVSESQAADLTLTKTAVAVRPIQVWVRTAGAIEKGAKGGRSMTVMLSPAEGELVKVDQRVRAFPPEARSSMFQARVTNVSKAADGRVVVTVTLVAPPREGSRWYVMEIVADRGELLSVPNEAIIEEGDTHVVYVEQQQGQYVPREIHIGAQGELYTHVIDGVKDGDQVVTFGSFFIDAEHKLKGTGAIAQAP